MKCTKCGCENPNTNKFCIQCGNPLQVKPQVIQDEEVLIDLSEAYTGNLAAAKEIVQSNEHTMDAIADASIRWIRNKDITLFREPVVSTKDGKTLETIGSNMDQAIRDLNYEERIVVLLHCIQNCSVEEIAQRTQITIDQVTYYLQSAYTKNNPVQKEMPSPSNNAAKQKQAQVRKPVNKKETKLNTDEPKFLQRITWKTEVAFVAVIAIVIGVFFGVKSYGSSQYKDGLQLMENGNYEQAVEPLLNAKRYGQGQNAGLKLAETYYALEDYENALKEYESCDTSKEEVKNGLVQTYQKLASEQIGQNNFGEAEKYLTSEYALNQDEQTEIQLKAVTNGGSYTDDDGNVFNAWGNPTKLYAKDQVYQLDLQYNEEQKYDSVQEYVKEGALKTTFNKFVDSDESELNWFLQNNKPVTYKYVALKNDSSDYVSKYSTITATKSEEMSITYEVKEDQIVSKEEKTGNQVEKSDYVYNGTLLTAIKSDSKTTEYTYDRDSRLTTEIIKQENITTIQEYEYDKNGYLITKKISSGSDPVLPFQHKQTIHYTNTISGNPFRLTITSNDQTVAQGYYVQGNGWIILYNALEEAQ